VLQLVIHSCLLSGAGRVTQPKGTLSDLDITRKRSTVAQRLAALPSETREANWIARHRASIRFRSLPPQRT
jgi:hypothetical protein